LEKDGFHALNRFFHKLANFRIKMVKTSKK